MKAGKRIIALLVLVLTVAGLLPMRAQAIDLIDRDEPVSLTIFCNDDKQPLPGATFRIYQVAAITDSWCGLAVTKDFENCVTDKMLNDPEVDWRTVLTTITSNMAGKGIKPAGTITTDAKGYATFTPENKVVNGVNPSQGLYLVMGDTHDNYETRYHESPFLVMLPTRPLENDTEKWDYSVLVDNCKHVPEDIDTVTVYKKWDLKGHKGVQTPSITVHLIAIDGKGVETEVDVQELSAANGWSYTWTGLDHNVSWTVKEDPVPGFGIPVVSRPDQNDPKAIRKFVLYITNTYVEPPPELPQTGLLWWPVPVLLTAGLLFVLVGLIRRRGEKREA